MKPSVTPEQIKDRIRPILLKRQANQRYHLHVTQDGILGHRHDVIVATTNKKAMQSLFFSRKPKEWYGWDDEKILNFVEVIGMGKDGLEQLLFGCITTLEVYTEDEILTVLEACRQYAELEERN